MLQDIKIITEELIVNIHTNETFLVLWQYDRKKGNL